MLDLNLLVKDVEDIVHKNDPDAYMLIVLAVGVYLDEYPIDEILKAFKDRNNEATVSDEHLFLSIDDVKLRVPLRPLVKGDNNDPPQPSQVVAKPKKVRPRNPRPRSPHP